MPLQVNGDDLVTLGQRKPFRSARKPPLSTRYVPLVASLRGYSRSRLRTDALAGITVAALALPASMAYADIAGLPVTAGLYSLLLPLVVYALLGSAPWLVVGPESTIALLVAAGLAPLAAEGTAEYTALAAALAVTVGAVYLAARLLRLGWIADYFSQAVLVGYITGVAILIVLGQFGKLVGLSSDQDNAVIAVGDIVADLGQANAATVALAAVSLLLLIDWFSDRLFFANVHFFKRRVWAAVDAAPKPTRHLVLDMAGVPGVDSSAATGLRELHDGLLARNVSLQIARATDPLEAAMDRFGLVELIGMDHFHGTVISAVESAARPDTTREDHGPLRDPDRGKRDTIGTAC